MINHEDEPIHFKLYGFTPCLEDMALFTMRNSLSDFVIKNSIGERVVIFVVVLLFNVHSKQLWSCQDGQLT